MLRSMLSHGCQPSPCHRVPACPAGSLRSKKSSHRLATWSTAASNADDGPSTSYSHLEQAWQQPAPMRGMMRQRRDIARLNVASASAISLGTLGMRATRQLQQLWQELQTHPLMRYKEIISRVLLTIGMLVILRLGYFIALPGIDLQHMPTLAPCGYQGESLIKALYGQANELPASLFDLGISPFINAQILMFVLLIIPEQLLPQTQWMSKLRQARKEGKSGEAFITSYVNMGAGIFALYLALLRAFELEPFALVTSHFIGKTCITLMAGSAILQFIANTITAHGIGNGTTLVIVTSIVSEYAGTLHQVMAGFESGGLGMQQLLLGLGGYLFILLLSVLMSLTELRLPMVHYSRTPTEPTPGNVGTDSETIFLQARQMLDQKAVERGAQPTYYPILLNASGMMSVIFAGSIWFFLYPKALELMGLFGLAAKVYMLQSSIPGLFIYGLLVFTMEFITPANQATDMAEYMGQINMGIKGVPPGEDTVQHLKLKSKQVKFWGGIAMAFLAITAYLFDQVCRQEIGMTLATTSTLILVGAVLQTSRQVESLLQAPRVQQQLEQERAVIKSLSFM